ALDSAVASLRGLNGELRGLTALLSMAIASYRDTDNSVLDLIGSAIATPFEAAARFPGAVVDGTAALFDEGGVAALQTFVTDDPALIDATVQVVGFAAPPVDAAMLRLLADGYFADGSPVVTSRGLDTRPDATRPPRSLAGLMAGLQLRNSGEGGEVDVKILDGPSGRRHVVVDIPGTKDWTPAHESADVTGWASNIRAIEGTPTTYEKGVLQAMQQAGVQRTDDVMVVGHSLGGMVAVALARDAVRSRRFNVTHVVTAGSPIGKFVGQLPAGVQVLALENRHDVVPHLDAKQNPDLPNVTTATFDLDNGTVGDDHGIDTSYEPGAAEVDASDDAAIRAFVEGAGGYFGASSVHTHRYVITRE
ncbi:MAG: alpha/beta fold hydrolase, partial [Jatrophihabitantaceae bacterium]